MATRLGEAFVEITTKSDKLDSGLNDAQRKVASAASGMEASFESVASSMATGFKVAAAAIAASLGAAFVAGIRAVDQYKLATIGVAASLTDMAKEGDTNLRATYASNLRYAEQTYEKVELAAAKFFASGKEMVQAWTLLSNKGIVLTSQQDINNLGIIVDKIKLATQGQNANIQIAQELRAVMTGQAKATDQIAKMLEDRLGPEWAKQLQAAREQGRLLEWLAGQFKGLGMASEDITATWEAQKSTFLTLIEQIGRAGLAGAYEDIVKVLAQINEYLTVHKDQLAIGIRDAWNEIKAVITDPLLVRFFSETLKVGSEYIQIIKLAVEGLTSQLSAMLGLLKQFPEAGNAAMGVVARALTGQMGGVGAILNAVNAVKGGTGEEPVTIRWGKVPVQPQIKPPAPTIATGGGAAKKPLGLEDINQQIDRFSEKLLSVYKSLEDANYDLWIAMAKDSGDFFQAGSLEVSKWASDTKQAIDKQLRDAQNSYRELAEKLGKEGGATPEAQAAVAEAKKRMDEAEQAAMQRYITLADQEAQKRKELIRLKYDEAVKTAELTLEYVTLTGTTRDVAMATIAKLEADREAAKVGKNEVQRELIDRIALEKIQLEQLKATGSVMDGFRSRLQEYFRTMDTDSMRGKEWADMLIKGFDQAADALAEFTMTGKMNFTDFANSVERDILRMVYRGLLLDMFKGIFGGEAGSGGLGWLSGLVGGLFGGGADLSHTSGPIGPAIEMASGGWINEPIFGVGKSGRRYTLGERGPEYVSPGGRTTQGTPINVVNHFVINGNPTRESQTQIAASVGNALQRAMKRNN